MRRFIKNRPLLIAMVIILILIILVVVSLNRPKPTGPEGVVGSVLSAVEGAFYSATNAVGDFFGNIFGSRDIDQENAELKSRVAELEQQLLTQNEIKDENSRLKELLQFGEQSEGFTYVGARVTAKEPGYWYETFTINAGRNHGIEEGMAVVVGAGLVGRIMETSGSYSKVLTIIDARSSFSVMMERTRFSGILKGQLQTPDGDASCVLSYLSSDTEYVNGDRIITSGVGEEMPKGIYIGDIVDIQKEDGAAQKTIEVRPAVDFSNIEEVLVIVGEKEE
ncbi:MAG: rod shape-determining protein MreC [Christensenellales bacterium]|jgi:rod shape-determining protein MreC